MLDKLHVDFAGEQRELNRAQFGNSPTFPAATRGDRFVPHRGHFFTQRLALDLHQAGKKFRDFFNTVIRSLRRFHLVTSTLISE